jgi:transaldolase/glucose-6-phosphate isomerase
VRSHRTGEPAARYVAIQAFLPPDPRTDDALRELRAALAERLPGIATTAGYGPRFLHSTGQLHKGGPDTGLFLQLVDDVESGPAIPDGHAEGGSSRHGFGDLVRSQAVGDYRALAERGRRVLRVRLRGDLYNALERLRSAVEAPRGKAV